jgi:hypothetical protein
VEGRPPVNSIAHHFPNSFGRGASSS